MVFVFVCGLVRTSPPFAAAATAALATMPRKGATLEVTEEDYLSLKEKFHLLEGDRKAYFETFENQKKHNDANMKQLRNENSELRLAIGDLKKENTVNVDQVSIRLPPSTPLDGPPNFTRV